MVARFARFCSITWPLAAALLCGCGAGADGEPGNGPPLLGVEPLGAPGVTINQVAIYQGVKRTLMLDGLPQGSMVPIVAGRPALVRVFYTTHAEYDGAPVLGRLRIVGQEPIDVEQPLTHPVSSDGALDSTLNFYVPGERLAGTFDYGVSILRRDEIAHDNPAAHFPNLDGTEPVHVDGIQNTIRIVIAPYAYHVDGSGRLPDLSPEHIESIRSWFVGMYPVSNVEMTVRQAEPWHGPALSPDGSGWMQLMTDVSLLRNADGAGADVYYYGLFNPADNFNTYCGLSCLLGLSPMNDSPPDTGTVGMRMSIGLGFNEVAGDTAVHEVGHAHGLLHAPCGGPDGIDFGYPYPDGGIGVWGHDMVHDVLHDPAVANDIMGYCNKPWISDYHFLKLYNRGKNVNLPDWQGDPLRYGLITVHPEQGAVFQHVLERDAPLGGRPVDVVVQVANGDKQPETGEYFRYDHLPGGMLLVPLGDDELYSAEFVLDGQTYTALR